MRKLASAQRKQKQLTRSDLYPPLHGQLSRDKDSKIIQQLNEFIAASGRKHSDIVSECVRVALPLIVSGKAAAMGLLGTVRATAGVKQS